jgi:hypothetical protein
MAAFLKIAEVCPIFISKIKFLAVTCSPITYVFPVYATIIYHMWIPHCGIYLHQ